LPTDAGRLEGQLSKIFQVAKHWDAILLLDEADVYLEQRAPNDLVRNGLVSVFLRMMEYCQGVMFLTTNRASLFDPAALSRIHLKLKYDNLNAKARHEVWKNFLDRAWTSHGPADISLDELGKLSKTQLNGREVRPLARNLEGYH
jgi:SpoVK/Ycf46/Vps4 family AAA+-type ATPase